MSPEAQRFNPEDKQVAKTVLESLIIRHDANQWIRSAQPPPAATG